MTDPRPPWARRHVALEAAWVAGLLTHAIAGGLAMRAAGLFVKRMR